MLCQSEVQRSKCMFCVLRVVASSALSEDGVKRADSSQFVLVSLVFRGLRKVKEYRWNLVVRLTLHRRAGAGAKTLGLICFATSRGQEWPTATRVAHNH
jgi:hypothetical protein